MRIERIREYVPALPLVFLLWLCPQPAEAQRSDPTAAGVAVTASTTSGDLGASHVSGIDTVSIGRVTRLLGGQVELRWGLDTATSGLSVVGRLAGGGSAEVYMLKGCRLYLWIDDVIRRPSEV